MSINIRFYDRIKSLALLFALLLCLAGLVSNTNAQVLYGSVIGTVTDTTGSSVPVAMVHLRGVT